MGLALAQVGRIFPTIFDPVDTNAFCNETLIDSSDGIIRVFDCIVFPTRKLVYLFVCQFVHFFLLARCQWGGFA